MVNYDALSIGLRVEFEAENNTIVSGIVKYKGALNGREGNWIGVEANQPVGYCNGVLEGRYYFKCPNAYGLFLTADQLRLSRTLKPKPRNLYKSFDSECDELLFKKSEPPKEHVACITQDYLERARSSFEKLTYEDVFAPAHRYASRETLLPPKVKKLAQKSETKTTGVFHPTSSISKTYMPREELELYTKLAWSHKNIKSLPRCNSKSNKTFDSFNMNRSNYIEPDANK